MVMGTFLLPTLAVGGGWWGLAVGGGWWSLGHGRQVTLVWGKKESTVLHKQAQSNPIYYVPHRVCTTCDLLLGNDPDPTKQDGTSCNALGQSAHTLTTTFGHQSLVLALVKTKYWDRDGGGWNIGYTSKSERMKMHLPRTVHATARLEAV